MLENSVSEDAANKRRGRLLLAGDRLTQVLLRSATRLNSLSLAMANDVSLEGEECVLKVLATALKNLEQLAAISGPVSNGPADGAAREAHDDTIRTQIAELITALATAFEAGLGAGQT